MTLLEHLAQRAQGLPHYIFYPSQLAHGGFFIGQFDSLDAATAKGRAIVDPQGFDYVATPPEHNKEYTVVATFSDQWPKGYSVEYAIEPGTQPPSAFVPPVQG